MPIKKLVFEGYILFPIIPRDLPATNHIFAGGRFFRIEHPIS
jgi:hypothetical protein